MITWTPERAKQWQKEWRERNRLHINEYNRLRRISNLNARAKDMTAVLRASAKRRGLEFDLTHEWIEKRLRVGICELTGRKFAIELRRANGLSPLTPSVDRKDSSKGYTPKNCRMILWCLNCAFGSWGQDATREILREWLLKKEAPAV